MDLGRGLIDGPFGVRHLEHRGAFDRRQGGGSEKGIPRAVASYWGLITRWAFSRSRRPQQGARVLAATTTFEARTEHGDFGIGGCTRTR
jgi:hypothetical protein